jgi:hypothetical protein
VSHAGWLVSFLDLLGMGAGVPSSPPPPPAAFTLSPNTGFNNSSTNTTATSNGFTLWTSGTVFGISGVGGATIQTNSVDYLASPQTADLTVVAGSATGTATVSDSTDAATAAFTITLSPPPPTVGGRRFFSTGKATTDFSTMGKGSATFSNPGDPGTDANQ